jgi:hypothetical protein
MRFARFAAIAALVLIVPPLAAATVGPTWDVPEQVVAEATSADGAIVTYRASAKNKGRELAVACTPPSDSQFALGRTTVRCVVVGEKEEDEDESASFPVVVQDTTAPVVTAPAPVELTSPGGVPVSASDSRVAAFLAGASATDAATRSPTVTNDAPSSFPVGVTPVTFTAVDAAGNASTARSTLTVVPEPAADVEPPGPVTRARAATGSRRVLLTWTAPEDADFARVEITRTAPGRAATVVYRGARARFTDTAVRNGVLYRYSIRAYDAAGNAGAEVTLSARPRASRLLTPLNGVALTRPPVLRWLATPGATYYNVQLWRDGKKILSVWPGRTSAALPGRWSYAGRRYTLRAGTYTWYVWPGFGSPTAARYGRLVGARTFEVLP